MELAQITTRRFVAGIVLSDDVVTETAPILRFLKGWKRDRVRAYCEAKGWRIRMVQSAATGHDALNRPERANGEITY